MKSDRYSFLSAVSITIFRHFRHFYFYNSRSTLPVWFVHMQCMQKGKLKSLDNTVPVTIHSHTTYAVYEISCHTTLRYTQAINQKFFPEKIPINGFLNCVWFVIGLSSLIFSPGIRHVPLVLRPWPTLKNISCLMVLPTSAVSFFNVETGILHPNPYNFLLCSPVATNLQ